MKSSQPGAVFLTASAIANSISGEVIETRSSIRRPCHHLFLGGVFSGLEYSGQLFLGFVFSDLVFSNLAFSNLAASSTGASGGASLVCAMLACDKVKPASASRSFRAFVTAHLVRAPSFLAAIETALPLQSSLVTSCKISKNNATQHSDITIQANIVPSLVSFEIELEEVLIVRNTQKVRKPKIAPATCPAIGHELAAEKIQLLV